MKIGDRSPRGTHFALIMTDRGRGLLVSFSALMHLNAGCRRNYSTFEFNGEKFLVGVPPIVTIVSFRFEFLEMLADNNERK